MKILSDISMHLDVEFKEIVDTITNKDTIRDSDSETYWGML
jgi:hypothetical protein